MTHSTTVDAPRVQKGLVFLLVSLASLFVLYPVLLETGHSRLLRVAFMGVLIAAVSALSERRRQMHIALVLAVPSAITQALSLASPNRYDLHLVTLTLALMFIGYVIAVVCRRVFVRGEVTGEKIAGAVCVYLLIGLAWSMLYALISLLQPGAFSLPISIESEYDFIYYSFVTLTTLGYGDITPSSSFARMASWMEAVIGQLFVAIMLARLVALQIAESPSGSFDE